MKNIKNILLALAFGSTLTLLGLHGSYPEQRIR